MNIDYNKQNKLDKKEGRKCNACYVTSAQKPLQYCAGCKIVKYCSKECQKADWKAHKQICRTKSEFAESIAAFSQSPLGMFSQRLLPDGISMQELDQRLEKWVKFHHQTLMAACLHALRLPDDESRARTHVMHLILLPRQDHGGHPGKWFKVVDAKALEWSEAEKKRTPWPESLAQVRDMQDDAQSKGQGRIAAAMLDCPPLSVQTVPFGSINNQMKQVKVLPIWREVLIKDVEEAKKFTRFGPERY